jgi:hypothetical protein
VAADVAAFADQAVALIDVDDEPGAWGASRLPYAHTTFSFGAKQPISRPSC